jgi:putative lysine transport system permease protein
MGGYLFLTLLASFLLRKLEKKLEGKSNYELVNTDQLVLTAGTYSFSGEAPYEEKNKDIGGEQP